MLHTVTEEDIINSVTYKEILGDDITSDLYYLIKKYHPDVNHSSKANDVIVKLTTYKDQIENGILFTDDISKENRYYCDKIIVRATDKDIARHSINKYNSLLGLNVNLDAYLPEEYVLTSNTEEKIVIKPRWRAIPLSSINGLPQKHINWIFSRILEFCAYMEKHSYIHFGINPSSVFICPENHGIQIVSFYHTIKKGENPKSLSGLYSSYYPRLTKHISSYGNSVDLELAIHTIKSIMAGYKYDDVFMNFINQTSTESPMQYYLKYREMLTKNYNNEFQQK